MMSWCIDWGSWSTSNDSHIHSKHIQGVWEHSYSVDEEMDPPSCNFHHDCSSQINWDGGIHGSHLGYIWCHTALVEAPDPHEVCSNSTPNMFKMFESIHMLGTGRWIHHHASSTMIVHLKLIEMAEFTGHTWATYDVELHWLRPQTHMKLFQLHSKHVQCVWEHSYAGDGEMDPPSCLFHHDHSSQFSWDGEIHRSHLGYIWCHTAVIEVLDPHGMIPTSTPNMFKVFENIHILWMRRWIHHHAISIMIVHLKLIEMAEFTGHTWATYDVILHWLMPQTHMKLSQLHSKHVQCVWEHSYAVDGEMDPPSCLFHYFV